MFDSQINTTSCYYYICINREDKHRGMININPQYWKIKFHVFFNGYKYISTDSRMQFG